MDVGFLIHDLGVRGAVRRVVELSNQLLERGGHIVTVYTKEGRPCEWLPLRTGVFPWDYIGRHDVLICCGGGRAGHAILRRTEVPRKAIYVLGIGYAQSETRPMLTDALEHNKTSFSRMVNEGVELLGNCTRIADYFRGQGYNCKVVSGGVDTHTFRPYSNKDSSRVLYAGTKRSKTGTADALKVMKILRSFLRLDGVSYAGRGLSQERLAQRYSSAFCYLDGHYGGGWNNPVAEAMACGTAVVCTDIDGVHDFAFHEETALLVKPGDTWAMASAIHRLIWEPDLRHKLETSALALIREFTWDRAAQQLEGWLKT